MNIFIDIEPKVIAKIANKIAIKVLFLELNNYAIIKVDSFSQNNELLDTIEFSLNGEDYQNWHDDNYLIQYVCNKYGFILQS